MPNFSPEFMPYLESVLSNNGLSYDQFAEIYDRAIGGGRPSFLGMFYTLIESGVGGDFKLSEWLRGRRKTAEGKETEIPYNEYKAFGSNLVKMIAAQKYGGGDPRIVAFLIWWGFSDLFFKSGNKNAEKWGKEVKRGFGAALRSRPSLVGGVLEDVKGYLEAARCAAFTGAAAFAKAIAEGGSQEVVEAARTRVAVYAEWRIKDKRKYGAREEGGKGVTGAIFDHLPPETLSYLSPEAETEAFEHFKEKAKEDANVRVPPVLGARFIRKEIAQVAVGAATPKIKIGKLEGLLRKYYSKDPNKRILDEDSAWLIVESMDQIAEVLRPLDVEEDLNTLDVAKKSTRGSFPDRGLPETLARLEYEVLHADSPAVRTQNFQRVIDEPEADKNERHLLSPSDYKQYVADRFEVAKQQVEASTDPDAAIQIFAQVKAEDLTAGRLHFPQVDSSGWRVFSEEASRDYDELVSDYLREHFKKVRGSSEVPVEGRLHPTRPIRSHIQDWDRQLKESGIEPSQKLASDWVIHVNLRRAASLLRTRSFPHEELPSVAPTAGIPPVLEPGYEGSKGELARLPSTHVDLNTPPMDLFQAVPVVEQGLHNHLEQYGYDSIFELLHDARGGSNYRQKLNDWMSGLAQGLWDDHKVPVGESLPLLDKFLDLMAVGVSLYSSLQGGSGPKTGSFRGMESLRWQRFRIGKRGMAQFSPGTPLPGDLEHKDYEDFGTRDRDYGIEFGSMFPKPTTFLNPDRPGDLEDFVLQHYYTAFSHDYGSRALDPADFFIHRYRPPETHFSPETWQNPIQPGAYNEDKLSRPQPGDDISARLLLMGARLNWPSSLFRSVWTRLTRAHAPGRGIYSTNAYVYNPQSSRWDLVFPQPPANPPLGWAEPKIDQANGKISREPLDLQLEVDNETRGNRVPGRTFTEFVQLLQEANVGPSHQAQIKYKTGPSGSQVPDLDNPETAGWIKEALRKHCDWIAQPGNRDIATPGKITEAFAIYAKHRGFTEAPTLILGQLLKLVHQVPINLGAPLSSEALAEEETLAGVANQLFHQRALVPEGLPPYYNALVTEDALSRSAAAAPQSGKVYVFTGAPSIAVWLYLGAPSIYSYQDLDDQADYRLRAKRDAELVLDAEPENMYLFQRAIRDRPRVFSKRELRRRFLQRMEERPVEEGLKPEEEEIASVPAVLPKRELRKRFLERTP